LSAEEIRSVPQFENEITITPLVERYFSIQQVVTGGGRYPFVMRYVGQLTMDSELAFAALSKELKRQRLMPLFLEEDGQQVILVTPALRKPRRSNPWINLLLFSLTVLSMLMAGAAYTYEGPELTSYTELFTAAFKNLSAGIPFAVSLLAILLAHEFGHYFAARYHNTAVTLPYFLPLPPPLSPLGTLGAFIQLKEPPRNKRILLDIGLAGPLAGLIVAVPVLILGLALSKVDTLPQFVPAGQAYSLEGNSIIYLLSKYLVHGQWLPEPLSYGGMPPLLYWVRFIFTGQPIPLGGADVMLHPVAWAGWAGLLVTALNLIPAGQLDGGHILYSLFGKRTRWVLPFILAGLAALGFFWSGWWLWVFLILFLGGSHAQPLDQITKLNPGRVALAILGLIIFILVFTPVPLQVIEGAFGG
jgi:membrane-associated protease RseP (regulator of RpoE activity)